MSSANILGTVIDEFLSVIEVERKLPPETVERLKRLAEEGGLSQQDNIEAALKGETAADDQAEKS